MSEDRDQLRAILEHNTGFAHPDLWIDYARHHGFQRITADPVPRCPDCSSAPSGSGWGQFVYYSTLIHLLECGRCGLVWADAHIDPTTIRQHFEAAYKGDDYFKRARKAVFAHLAKVIAALAPTRGRILDIGGARGDLMAAVVARRPDVSATVNDLSKVATDSAAKDFGLTTLTGDAHVLLAHSRQYDVVVLSDVLYYEPNLPVLWSALARLIRPGGSIVIRVPNKARLIRLGQAWFQLTHRGVNRSRQDRVSFYNPEHIFVLRRSYLRDRIRSIGFPHVRFLPSPLLTRTTSAGHSAVFKLASIVNHVSRGSLVLTPSMLAIGVGRRESSVSLK